MRKIIAAIMALTMIASVTSCGKKPSTDTSSSGETTTTTAEVTTAESGEETTAETTPAIKAEDLKYDFTGLVSEKYINLLSKSEKYYLKYNIQDGALVSETYIDGQNILAKQQTENLPFILSMLVKDDQIYMMCDDYKAYCKSTNNSVQGVLTQFKDLGYVESGETEANGVKYKYDEYANKNDTANTLKILIDDKGALYGFESGGMISVVDELTEDFSSDDMFKLPEDYKEMSEEELYSQLTAAMQATSETGDSSESSDSASSEGAAETSAAQTTENAN